MMCELWEWWWLILLGIFDMEVGDEVKCEYKYFKCDYLCLVIVEVNVVMNIFVELIEYCEGCWVVEI